MENARQGPVAACVRSQRKSDQSTPQNGSMGLRDDMTGEVAADI
jgi:hypothetical protein